MKRLQGGYNYCFFLKGLEGKRVNFFCRAMPGEKEEVLFVGSDNNLAVGDVVRTEPASYVGVAGKTAHPARIVIGLENHEMTLGYEEKLRCILPLPVGVNLLRIDDAFELTVHHLIVDVLVDEEFTRPAASDGTIGKNKHLYFYPLLGVLDRRGLDLERLGKLRLLCGGRLARLAAPFNSHSMPLAPRRVNVGFAPPQYYGPDRACCSSI